MASSTMRRGKQPGLSNSNSPGASRPAPSKRPARAFSGTTSSSNIGYDCEDADIVAHYTERDDPTYKDDAVEIFINPDPLQTFYYGMEMNARAVLFDYFYVFPKLLLKRVNFSGIQLATNIRGTLNQTGDRD